MAKTIENITKVIKKMITELEGLADRKRYEGHEDEDKANVILKRAEANFKEAEEAETISRNLKKLFQ